MNQVIDMNAAMQRVEGDRELLGELARLFLEQIPGLVDMMKEALASGDARTLNRAAHSLKGSAGNVAAVGVFETAASIEQLSQDSRLSDVPPRLACLETQLQQLTVALNQLG